MCAFCVPNVFLTLRRRQPSLLVRVACLMPPVLDFLRGCLAAPAGTVSSIVAFVCVCPFVSLCGSLFLPLSSRQLHVYAPARPDAL